jgi:hypothetical protein
MKLRDLEEKLRSYGWWIKRDTGRHTVWTNGEQTEPVPRHSEINELLAKKILKKVAAFPGKK